MSKSKNNILKTSDKGLWNTQTPINPLSPCMPFLPHVLVLSFFKLLKLDIITIIIIIIITFFLQCFRFTCVYRSLFLMFLLAFSDLPFDIIFLLFEVHHSHVT